MNNQTLGQFFYSSNKASSDLMLETSLIVMYYCIVSGLKKKEFGSRNRVLFGAGAKLWGCAPAPVLFGAGAKLWGCATAPVFLRKDSCTRELSQNSEQICSEILGLMLDTFFNS